MSPREVQCEGMVCEGVRRRSLTVVEQVNLNRSGFPGGSKP